MIKSASIARFQEMGYYVYSKYKGKSFIDGIMLGTKKSITYQFLVALDSKCENDCQEMEATFSKVSTRKEFSNYL